jgi:hypothetical protein
MTPVMTLQQHPDSHQLDGRRWMALVAVSYSAFAEQRHSLSRRCSTVAAVHPEQTFGKARPFQTVSEADLRRVKPSLDLLAAGS